MRLQLGIAIAIIGLLALPSGRARADGDVPGHVLARVQSDDDVPGLNDDYGTQAKDHVQTTGLYSFTVPPDTTAAEFADALNSDPRVAWAETDRYIRPPEIDGDPFHFPFDIGHNRKRYISQQAYMRVNIRGVNRFSSGAGVIVAVLDTGATFAHPELARNYLQGYNILAPGLPPRDIADGVTNVGVGHGTMVAGIIVRLAPSVRILPIRVLNGDGRGTVLDVARGIDYAVRHGARVINMSFGGHQASLALNDAIQEADDANVVLVAAAGNDGVDAPHYPAACDNVIGVASIEDNDARSPWSNFGPTIRVAAPGGGINSTFSNGGYADWSGTSFAAPFIAGEAALMISKSPLLNSSQVGDAIGRTARDMGDSGLGDGLIDILNGVSSVK